jgi:secreted trypsin-like serine protease
MIRILIVFAIANFGQAEVLDDNYVVNGKAANISEVPYQASLMRDNSFNCGGSIISKSYILTAAHCVTKVGTYKVRVGSSYSDKEGTVLKVTIVTIHPDYQSPPYNNDFALLRLETPIKEFNDKIQSIALASRDQELENGSSALVSGFGRIFWGGPRPEQLQKAEVSLIDSEDCKAKYNGLVKITEQMLCAGTEGGACHGKSILMIYKTRVSS